MWACALMGLPVPPLYEVHGIASGSLTQIAAWSSTLDTILPNGAGIIHLLVPPENCDPFYPLFPPFSYFSPCGIPDSPTVARASFGGEGVGSGASPVTPFSGWDLTAMCEPSARVEWSGFAGCSHSVIGACKEGRPERCPPCAQPRKHIVGRVTQNWVSGFFDYSFKFKCLFLIQRHKLNRQSCASERSPFVFILLSLDSRFDWIFPIWFPLICLIEGVCRNLRLWMQVDLQITPFMC